MYVCVDVSSKTCKYKGDRVGSRDLMGRREGKEMTMESMRHEAGGEVKEASRRGRAQLRRMDKGPAITRQEDMNQLPD